MSFIAYLIVLIFAVGSALFGLDLLTSPLPQHSATHVAATSPGPAPDKLARRMADEKAMQREGRPGTLTPVYPSHPGTNDARSVTPANLATQTETQTAMATKPPQTTGSAPSETTGTVAAHNEVANVSTTPQVAPQPQAQPAAQPQVQQPQPTARSQAQVTAQPTTGQCDVAACSAAYHSFRASDCTYQPYEGLRRSCVAAPTAQHLVQRAKDHAPPMDVRSVARQQVRPQQGDYDDDAVEDDDVDAPNTVPSSIVIMQSPRW